MIDDLPGSCDDIRQGPLRDQSVSPASTSVAGRPLRVLHAYNRHRGGGGADNAARATIDLSRRMGLEVEVFTRDSEDLAPDLRGRIQAGVSAVYPFGSVGKFAAALERFRPDVVHIHEVFPLVSPWILPECTKRGVPVVMTCVDYRITCPVVTHLREGEICVQCTGGREYRAFLNNCRGNLPESATVAIYNTLSRSLGLFRKHVTRFIAPSEFTRKWLIEHTGCSPENVTTISPVVEIPPTAADAGAGAYVAFAGRFAPEKGIDVFLEAARLTGLPFKLSRNEASLVKIDIPDTVDVVVTRNRDELNEFYRRARMVIVPSIWFETFGLVGAEAMSHGIPVIASRIGALEYLIEDGVDGLLFERGNAADLAEKVVALWNDLELVRKFGARGREKAIAGWAPERHFAHLNDVYRQVRRSD